MHEVYLYLHGRISTFFGETWTKKDESRKQIKGLFRL